MKAGPAAIKDVLHVFARLASHGEAAFVLAWDGDFDGALDRTDMARDSADELHIFGAIDDDAHNTLKSSLSTMRTIFTRNETPTKEDESKFWSSLSYVENSLVAWIRPILGRLQAT